MQQVIIRDRKGVVGAQCEPIERPILGEALDAIGRRAADVYVGSKGIVQGDQVGYVVVEVCSTERGGLLRQGLLEAEIVAEARLGLEVRIGKEVERRQVDEELVQ